MLAATSANIVVDLGGDSRTSVRVSSSALPPGVRTHSGSFASFASLISQSKLFVWLRLRGRPRGFGLRYPADSGYRQRLCERTHGRALAAERSGDRWKRA